VTGRVISGPWGGQENATGGGSGLPPGGEGPNNPDMEKRVALLERGFEELRASVGRIEAAQTELLKDIRDFRRDVKEVELPAIRSQLAGLDASLREKPAGKEFLALANSMNGTLYKAFGLAMTLLVTGVGAVVWLHRQGLW